MGLLRFFQAGWDAQRGHLFAWLPVAMGFGIVLYFALHDEPGWAELSFMSALFAVSLLAASQVKTSLGQVFFLVLCFVAFGFISAMARAHLVAGPILFKPIYGFVEGRVLRLDRSGSGAMRLTLDRVTLDKGKETPRKIRISLLKPDETPIFPGDIIRVKAFLSPPGGAVEPGGFDFQRFAWFKSIGAMGFARDPPDILGREVSGWVMVSRIRQRISRFVAAHVAPEQAGVASAILTGDRSGIAQETLKALRASNLAHLLAISGLHMGLLTGFIFAVTRAALALIPWVALRVDVKKIAAFIALLVGAIYLALSGGNVATQRAFIMVAVMLVGLCLSRRSFSLRQVAIAALIIMSLYPESVMGPGFQMSFAATIALITVFTWLRHLPILRNRWLLNWGFGVFMSSFVAGMATAPFAALHFNMFSQYGLVANLLSVPVMGVVVMPAAVFATLTIPFGVDGLGWMVMDWGLAWILNVADVIAAQPNVTRVIAAPSGYVLPYVAMGGLLLCLMQSWPRVLAVGPAILAILFWSQSERPDVLISPRADLIGIKTPEGRGLSQERAGRFAAEIWTQNDGARLDRHKATELWSAFKPNQLVHLHFKRDRQRAFSCSDDQIIVVNEWRARNVTGRCLILDRRALTSLGSTAINLGGLEPKLISARERQGNRLWSPWQNPKVLKEVSRWVQTQRGPAALVTRAKP